MSEESPTLPPTSRARETPSEAPAVQDLAKASLDQSQAMQALIEAFESFVKETFPGSVRGIHKGIAEGFRGIDERVDAVNVKIDTFIERYDDRLDRVEGYIGTLAAEVSQLAGRVKVIASEIDQIKLELDIHDSEEGRSSQPG